MRTTIEHSGSVNGDERFTFRLVEIDLVGSGISVQGGTASLRTEVTEAELRDMIERGRAALARVKLYRRFHAGGMSAEDYDAALRDWERTSFAEPT